MAKTRRHEKNLAKVQSMIDGTYSSEYGKLQVGQYEPTKEETRKVGDKWVDSDGVQWEQKQGFKVKGKMRRHYSWDQNCKDCGTNCGSTKGELHNRNNKTFIRMGRCYYCQIDFEAKLKSKRIGDNNNKHFFWVKLMTIKRWLEMEKEANERMIQIFDTNTSNKAIDNALANANIVDAREAAK